MICTKCRRPVQDGSVVCSYCGEKLMPGTSVPQQVASEPWNQQTQQTQQAQQYPAPVHNTPYPTPVQNAPYSASTQNTPYSAPVQNTPHPSQGMMPPPWQSAQAMQQTTPLSENPMRAVYLAGVMIIVMLLVGITTSGWKWESEYTYIFQLVALASASYLIQKTQSKYLMAAGIIGIAAVVIYVLGFLIYDIRSALFFSGSVDFGEGVFYALRLFASNILVAAAVLATSFLSGRITRGDTRTQTTIAALLCAAAYLIINLLSSFILFPGDPLRTFVMAGFGGIPDALALGLAIKLVSMLCLMKSTRIQTSIGPKIWFGICLTVTTLSLLMLPSMVDILERPSWSVSVLLLTILGIVGYFNLLRSRRIGYVLVLLAAGMLLFGQFGFSFSTFLAEMLSAGDPVTAILSAFASLTAVVNPAITGLVLLRGWKTLPAEQPLVEKRTSKLFLIGSIIALALGTILFMHSCMGYFDPGSNGHFSVIVFFTGPLLWGAVALAGLYATISCLCKQIRAPKFLLIINLITSVLALLFCVLMLFIGSSPYSGDFQERPSSSTSSFPTEGNSSNSSSNNSGNSSNNQSGSSDSSGSSSNATNGEGLPATFTAYGNTYRVEGYVIELNAAGNTMVKLSGTGFDVLPLRNGQFQMPLDCVLVTGGSEVSWSSGSAGRDELEFEFDGEQKPDSIIITAGDDDSQRVVLLIN